MLSAWQGFSLFPFFLSLWYDPAGDQTHSLAHAKRALYHYANAGIKRKLLKNTITQRYENKRTNKQHHITKIEYELW